MRSGVTILSLVAANLLPLLGVLFLGWSLQEVLALYWGESGVVGAWTLIRMLRIGGLHALPMCAFFVVHFGMFMAGHAAFLVAFFWIGEFDFDFFGPLVATAKAIWPMLLVLFASHGVSYLVHVVQGGEPLRRAGEPVATALGREMARPYGRIVAMHVAIVLGAGIVMITGAGAVVLVILIAVKIAVDIASHRREHARRAARDPAPARAHD